ncbi:Mg/Co/Ni transporter MgtE / CBS domain protein [Thioalkalivibrio nitratireducens DSM 14787]|uniref:Magnesium transporter MgtE n=1 Tax=Thioalkalivibrio nitratireducens (strain DSM 14787 / UNIQEM 213 / ALEN2) TaxID=1255043 RepID=L0DWV0_THIND|nr:magnesium transporter [Thioalkalivibrio nitratireducens]AGA34079.1 Mg/Co/Ni transporter MgtE / CBS domain protein [Thioalkalivibrio nitratireducens DSM 14787]
MNAIIEESPTLADRLRDALEHDAVEHLAELIDENPAQDIALALGELPRQHWHALFERLNHERTAEIYAHLPTEHQTVLLEQLDPAEATRLIGELSYDDAAAVLDELEDDHAEAILAALPEGDQQALSSLLAYPEESAGRIMTPEFATVRPEWTVAEALDHLREHSEIAETVNTIFAVSPEGQLLGWMRLKELLLSRPSVTVESRIHTDIVSIEAQEDQEEAARRISHYDLDVLPVVDERGVILGIITVDDVLDIIRDETTEDFHRMAAVGDMPLSLRDASMRLLYRKRVGWLVILVLVNLLSGTAIAFFEASIEAVVALVFFLPMVIASGGNAGAQASTLMVRALATGDIQTRDWFRMAAKEVSVSAGLGISMAAAIWLTGNWLGNLEVANAIALAMFLVVLFGSMFGMSLPFLLTRLRLDPATASAPLITSVVDVIGIIIYFGVATAILQLA